MMLPIGHFDKARKADSSSNYNKDRLAFIVDSKRFFAKPDSEHTLIDTGSTNNLSGVGGLKDLQAKLQASVTRPSVFSPSGVNVNAE